MNLGPAKMNIIWDAQRSESCVFTITALSIWPRGHRADVIYNLPGARTTRERATATKTILRIAILWADPGFRIYIFGTQVLNVGVTKDAAIHLLINDTLHPGDDWGKPISYSERSVIKPCTWCFLALSLSLSLG